MNGVLFGNLHSYEDLGLILASKNIGAPRVKTQVIDIPGADGQLDYTEYFGKISYYNRLLSFEFSAVGSPTEFVELYSRLQNALNGRKMQVILDEEPDFYYIGRASVNDWASSVRIGKFVINVDVEPFKYKRLVTLISDTISAVKAINCINLKKEVIPKITASHEVRVTYGNYSRVFTGTITDDNIVFGEGQNVLTFTPISGTVAITIEYQEGGL